LSIIHYKEKNWIQETLSGYEETVRSSIDDRGAVNFIYLKELRFVAAGGGADKG
jgi:hypothetical protein